MKAPASLLVVCCAVLACGDDGTGAGGSGGSGGTGGSGGAGAGGAGGEGASGGAPSTGGTGGTGAGETGGAPSVGGSGGDGGGEGGGGPMKEFSCSPEDGSFVNDVCGVFVQPNAPPGGAGTRASPVGTIAEALPLIVNASRIYVCEGGLTDAVQLPSGIAVHGGLDCADWHWDLAQRTNWTALANTVPLKITGTPNETNLITGFSIRSVDATQPSGSSIAVIVNQASVDFERVLFQSGAGQPGTAGMAGMAGQNGGNGESSSGANADGGSSSCGSNGGDGGPVFPLIDGWDDGRPGEPDQENGGRRYINGGMLNGCRAGGAGDTFGNTTAAAGSAAVGLGTLNANGYVGPSAGPGVSSTVHGGGGGGGGARPDEPGGAGGGGGCGGMGGAAGTFGGSSLALISIASTVTITDSSFVVSSAGNGGAGGAGGAGGTGGLPGNGYLQACDGGAGGQGQRGGMGSAGAGGHQIGIAYTGAVPQLMNTLLPEVTAGGTGGPNGVAAPTQQF